MIKSGINLPGVFVAFSDIATVFKSIARVFSTGTDPDKDLFQRSAILTNEITDKGMWLSTNEVELEVNIRKGLEIIYHYNSEALENKKSFQKYSHDVNFLNLPDGVETTIFFLGRSQASNKCDHKLSNKDAMGFLALFSPPIDQGGVINYRYLQRYKAFIPYWGGSPIQLHKDFRFLRETKYFKRIIISPKQYYETVNPIGFLLDESKRKKLGDDGKISFHREAIEGC